MSAQNSPEMPAFHSPERFISGNRSPEDDTWAAAVMLHYLVTGSLPFPGNTAGEVRQKLATLARSPLSAFGVGDDELEAILSSFLTPRVTERATSINDMRQRLEQWLSAQGVTDLPPLDLQAYDEDEDEDEDEDDIRTVAVGDFTAMRAQLAQMGIGVGVGPPIPMAPAAVPQPPPARQPPAPVPAAIGATIQIEEPAEGGQMGTEVLSDEDRARLLGDALAAVEPASAAAVAPASTPLPGTGAQQSFVAAAAPAPAAVLPDEDDDVPGNVATAVLPDAERQALLDQALRGPGAPLSPALPPQVDPEDNVATAVLPDQEREQLLAKLRHEAGPPAPQPLAPPAPQPLAPPAPSDKAADEHPSVLMSFGEKTQFLVDDQWSAPAKPAAGPQPAALQPAALQPAALQPAALQPAALQPAALQPAALQPAALRPAALQPAALRPAALQPAALRPAALQPAALQPAALQPAALRPAAAKPAEPRMPPGLRPMAPAGDRTRPMVDSKWAAGIPEPTAVRPVPIQRRGGGLTKAHVIGMALFVLVVAAATVLYLMHAGAF